MLFHRQKVYLSSYEKKVDIISITDSQNFLHSKKLVSALVDMSNIQSDDTVLEIGPGKGIITEALSHKGCKVIAVEYDKSLAALLMEKFSGNPDITILKQDILKFDLHNKSDYKVFSNIPFNITTGILSKLLDDSRVLDVYLIMQYEAFMRFAGAPFGEESYRALLYKPFIKSELLYKFSPTDFHPSPNVRIVFAHFSRIPKNDVNKKEYQDFISFLFQEKGQIFIDKLKRIFTYEQIKRICRATHIDKNQLISEVSLDQISYVYQIYQTIVPPDKKGLVSGAKQKKNQFNNHLSKRHRNSSTKNKW